MGALVGALVIGGGVAVTVYAVGALAVGAGVAARMAIQTAKKHKVASLVTAAAVGVGLHTAHDFDQKEKTTAYQKAHSQLSKFEDYFIIDKEAKLTEAARCFKDAGAHAYVVATKRGILSFKPDLKDAATVNEGFRERFLEASVGCGNLEGNAKSTHRNEIANQIELYPKLIGQDKKEYSGNVDYEMRHTLLKKKSEPLEEKLERAALESRTALSVIEADAFIARLYDEKLINIDQMKELAIALNLSSFGSTGITSRPDYIRLKEHPSYKYISDPAKKRLDMLVPAAMR